MAASELKDNKDKLRLSKHFTELDAPPRNNWLHTTRFSPGSTQGSIRLFDFASLQFVVNGGFLLAAVENTENGTVSLVSVFVMSAKCFTQ